MSRIISMRLLGSAAVSFLIGVILTVIGFLFLLCGALAWGIVELPLHASTFPEPNEQPLPKRLNAIFRIAGITTTVTGALMIITGMILCSLTPFLMVREQRRYHLAYTRPIPRSDGDQSIYFSRNQNSETVQEQLNIIHYHECPTCFQTNPKDSSIITSKSHSNPDSTNAGRLELRDLLQQFRNPSEEQFTTHEKCLGASLLSTIDPTKQLGRAFSFQDTVLQFSNHKTRFVGPERIAETGDGVTTTATVNIETEETENINPMSENQ